MKTMTNDPNSLFIFNEILDTSNYLTFFLNILENLMLKFLSIKVLLITFDISIPD